MTEAEAQQPVRLPFDPRKQLAVLGHIITKNIFFQQARQRVKPAWFNDVRCAKVFKAACDFWDVWKRMPTIDELKASKTILMEPVPEQNTLRATIERAVQETTNFGLDVLRSELTEWMHARIYLEGINTSLNLYNNRRFQECFKLIQAKVRELRETKFDEDVALSFKDPASYLAQTEVLYDNALTLGLKIFDDALVPSGDSKGGSLLRGDTTIFLAPSNVGKTTTLITVARHNILRDKHVLWFSHEGRQDDLRMKMLCSVMGLSHPELMTLYREPGGIDLITNFTDLIERQLVYVPWAKPGMTVEDLVPVIERRQEEHVAETGRGFDMLVDDYPGKLSTERAKGGHLPPRAIDCAVYDYFVMLALEHNWHCVAAIQTNRAGSVANRDDERILTMEDVRESFDVMMMATNVITINRDARAEARNRVAYHVAKSRSSSKGRTIVCRSNYAASLTHDEKLGGTWYRGTETLSDQIDTYLAEFNGKCCPGGADIGSAERSSAAA